VKKPIHKNKFLSGWYTKLCDPKLYIDVNVATYWKDVTCKRCLKLKPAPKDSEGK